MGILAGMQIREKQKRKAGFLALFVFLVTYIPLMKKFVGIVMEKDK